MTSKELRGQSVSQHRAFIAAPPEVFNLITEGSAQFFPTQHPGDSFPSLKWSVRPLTESLEKFLKEGLTQLVKALWVVSSVLPYSCLEWGHDHWSSSSHFVPRGKHSGTRPHSAGGRRKGTRTPITMLMP